MNKYDEMKKMYAEAVYCYAESNKYVIDESLSGDFSYIDYMLVNIQYAAKCLGIKIPDLQNVELLVCEEANAVISILSDEEKKNVTIEAVENKLAGEAEKLQKILQETCKNDDKLPDKLISEGYVLSEPIDRTVTQDEDLDEI